MKKWCVILALGLLVVGLVGCATTNTKEDRQMSTQAASVTTVEGGEALTSSISHQISSDQAKNIAFEAAGVVEADVTRLTIDLDYDDDARRWEYEVDFHVGNKEYDIDMDASTGEILRNEAETDSTRAPAQSETKAPSQTVTQAPTSAATKAPAATKKDLISRDEAKAVALARVGSFTGQVVDYECELDFDDDTRRWEYEISFNVGRIEYEFVIDAANGSVIREKIDRDD